MLDRIDSRELSEWMAFYKLEPFGEDRADLRMAILAQVCASPYSKKPVKVEDFIPKFDGLPAKKVGLKDFLKGLCSGHNKQSGS